MQSQPALFSKANGLLFITAFIWGITFVFQRQGLEYMGPITFNALRFILGALCLLPLLIFRRLPLSSSSSRAAVKGGLIAGLILFSGALLQQYSIQYTALANVGFITGLYVILVPILGLFLLHKYTWAAWLGGVIACAGLYLLSGVEDQFSNRGDLLALCGALFWALHIMVLAYWVKQADIFTLAFVQFAVCGLLSLIGALLFESAITSIEPAGLLPVAAAGIISTALAFTLQIIGQAKVAPFHAAIIFSLEAVFAALAGYVMFNELLTSIEMLGCALMLLGCIVAQYPVAKAATKV